MEKLNSILSLIKEYINETTKPPWRPGIDWVQYAGPYYDESEYIEGIKTLLNGWLVLGNKSISFENQLCELFGKKFGIVTNSGSSSNLLMISALKSKNLWNLPEKTKIIVPIAGFPTTLNPIIQLGFIPAFVDIELDTLNPKISDIDLQAYKGARALIFAHVLGNPPNMDELMRIVKDRQLIFVEDCCDALGTSYKSQPLGSFGELASCSFYPAHHITCGEGGFVGCKTYNQDKVLRSLRDWGRGCYCSGKKASLSIHGACGTRFKNWLPAFENTIFDHKYVYTEIGYNLKPIELQCAIGLEQLKKLPIIKEKRVENYNALFSIFKKYEEFFILPKATQYADVSWFAFPLTIKDNSPFNRSDICNYLELKKIQTRNYFGGNLLLQPAYSDLSKLYGGYEEIKRNYPNATKASTDTFFLGTSPVISTEQTTYIGEIINEFISKYA